MARSDHGIIFIRPERLAFIRMLALTTGVMDKRCCQGSCSGTTVLAYYVTMMNNIFEILTA